MRMKPSWVNQRTDYVKVQADYVDREWLIEEMSQ